MPIVTCIEIGSPIMNYLKFDGSCSVGGGFVAWISFSWLNLSTELRLGSVIYIFFKLIKGFHTQFQIYGFNRIDGIKVNKSALTYKFVQIRGWITFTENPFSERLSCHLNSQNWLASPHHLKVKILAIEKYNFYYRWMWVIWMAWVSFFNFEQNSPVLSVELQPLYVAIQFIQLVFSENRPMSEFRGPTP